MKYIEITSRNVYFTKRTEDYLENIVKRAANANVVKWVKSNYTNWLINKAELNILNSIPKEAPKWLIEKFDKEKIYKVIVSDVTNLDHIIDYLNTRTNNVSNMAVEEVFKQVKAWDEYLANRHKSEDGKIKIIHKYDDGMYWAKLLSARALDYEGANMNHCVANYWKRVRDGYTCIYSLRDSNNKPHITVEYSTSYKTISQVQGKNNTQVTEKYRPYFLDFINSKYISLNLNDCELERYGFLIFKTKNTYQILDTIYLQNNKDLPDKIIVDNLEYDPNKLAPTLPDGLLVKHNLNLSETNATTLPNRLTVMGNLLIQKTQITEIPKDCKVYGEFNIRETNIKLPSNYVFEGDVVIDGKIVIPSNTTVKGSLLLQDWKGKLSQLKLKDLSANTCTIKEISDCSFTSDFTFIKCNIKKFKSNITKNVEIEFLHSDIIFDDNISMPKAKIYMSGNSVLKVANSFTVNILELHGNNFETLPNKLKLKQLILKNTSFQSLPEKAVIDELIIYNIRSKMIIPKSVKIKSIKCSSNMINNVVNHTDITIEKFGGR